MDDVINNWLIAHVPFSFSLVMKIKRGVTADEDTK